MIRLMAPWRAVLLFIAACLLAGCGTGAGTGPDGPRNGAGERVDAKTGVTLPGQPQGGGGGGGGM